MNDSQRRRIVLKQFRELKKLLKTMRLAADGWDVEWKTLISILMSARTRDEVTIAVAEKLFKKYNTIQKLSMATPEQVYEIIRPINFSRVKSRTVSGCVRTLLEKYNGNPPHKIEMLIELPGVGRKTANVFLATYGHDEIGVDVHVGYHSRYLGWTKHEDQKRVEEDLKKLFPRKYWRDINWVLVQFGKTYVSRKKRNIILDKIKLIK